MRRVLSVLSIFFQLGITFGVLFSTYMLSAMADMMEVSSITLIGFLLIQPIMGTIITGLTIIILLIIGLPIRTNGRLRRFWLARPYLPVLGAVSGSLLLILAHHAAFTEVVAVYQDDVPLAHTIPGLEITLTGWMLLGFSLLHFYPRTLLPRRTFMRQ